MQDCFITQDTPISNSILNAIAHIPTEYLTKIVEIGFFQKLKDEDFMRIATLLAKKSYSEGGCPIGAVIVDSEKNIIGKGHNTLIQENDVTEHGEIAALRDAGRVAKMRGEGPVDFRTMHLFTSLTPCPVCCAQIIHRCNFKRVIIGDVTNAESSVEQLRYGDKSIEEVVILEDPIAVALYREYAALRPDLNAMDWGGYRAFTEKCA